MGIKEVLLQSSLSITDQLKVNELVAKAKNFPKHDYIFMHIPLVLCGEDCIKGLRISLFLFLMLAFCFFLMRKDLGILAELS